MLVPGKEYIFSNGFLRAGLPDTAVKPEVVKEPHPANVAAMRLAHAWRPTV
jgi:hypothetical protein